MRAFEEIQLLSLPSSSTTKIDAFHANSQTLLIASSTSLLVYTLENECQKATLVRALKNFCKKSISQMEIVQELDMLVALVDGSVCLYDLDSFQLLSSIQKTRNASTFLVSPIIESVQKKQSVTTTPLTPSLATLSKRLSKLPSNTNNRLEDDDDSASSTAEFQQYPHDSDGIPSLVTRLIIVVKKKLLVLRWVDNDYLDTLEFNLPDKVRSISQVGPYQLCFASQKDYYLFDMLAGKSRLLFSALGSVLPSQQQQQNSMSWTSSEPFSSIFNPLVARLSNDECAVLKENTVVFIGQDGKPTRSYGLQWSDIPEQLAYNFPYIISLFGNANATSRASTLFGGQVSTSSIIPSSDASTEEKPQDSKITMEIRNVSTQSLIQQFTLSNLKILAAFNGRIYVSSDNSLWILIPINIQRQVDQLVECAQFDDALDLIDQIDSIPANEKKEKLYSVTTMKAVHLFFSKLEYERSFKIIKDLQFATIDVLSAFSPELIPESIRKAYSIDLSSSQKELKKSKSNLFTTSVQVREQSNLEIFSKVYRIPTLPLTRNAIDEIVHFLTERRGKLLKTLNNSEINSEKNQIEEELAMIDTTLLLAYLEINEALVGPLLRVKNRVIVDDAEEYLSKAKKYADLVELYSGKGLHRRALSLLAKQAKVSGSPLFGYSPSISYMQKLGVEHFELVMEFSTSILTADPNEGLKIFLEGDETIRTSISVRNHFPRDRVLAHLEKIDHKLSIKYLEHLIYGHDDQTSDFHNRVASFYLDKVLESKERKFLVFRSDDDTGALSVFRRFIKESKFYKPERLLSRLPPDEFFEEKAILFHRMEQYDRAISIYISQVRSLSTAVEYCDMVWKEKGDLVGKQSFLYLMKAYIAQTRDFSKDDPFFSVLAQYGDRFYLNDLLRIIPSSLPLDYLVATFHANLKSLKQQQHFASISTNLLKGEKSSLEQALFEIQKHNLVVRDTTLCSICKRRMGTGSVLVAVKQAKIRVPAHLSCWSNNSKPK